MVQISVNGVEIYRFKAKDSKINKVSLWLSNVTKDFSADNIWKRLDYTDKSMIFQLINSIDVDIWIFINIWWKSTIKNVSIYYKIMRLHNKKLWQVISL